ncbi:MAG: hypothetical protein WEC14_09265 [Chloroflexota bacterium]
MPPDLLGPIISALVGAPRDGRRLPFVDPGRWLVDPGPSSDAEVAGAANMAAAFLVALTGPDAPARHAADRLLADPPHDAPAELVDLLREGLPAVRDEVGARARDEPAFAAALAEAATLLADPATDDDARTHAVWSVLFPEALGPAQDVHGAVAARRARRQVRITAPAPAPIRDPWHEILFTSNVLLGLPLASSTPADEAALDPTVADAVRRARGEPQRHWFDHPVPIGIDPERNELLHGLRGLDDALAVERERMAKAGRAIGDAGRAVCVLSVSVTHPALRDIARRYVEVELRREAALLHLDVLVISETDARRLVDEVLRPAAHRYLGADDDTLDVVGVDGEYGRHYSFLKAIAALWHVLVDPAVRATFKIDLDQVFPQVELVKETGRSALEHLRTPAWGARGRDAEGHEVELGMIAGALVNQRDIKRGLFTPDVTAPSRPPRWDEHAFFSVLPQAVSTSAEMMERYDGPEPDGRTTVLERVHVTGGTNGILVEALRRHRPFTPSCIGRAEDQAYILSVLGLPGPRLTYLHAAGLVMRHDKEAYAREAIEAAHVGKLVGDYLRILVFSAYASDVERVKALTDPFTGAFVSRIPVTVVLVRFALKVLALSADGDEAGAREFAALGAMRIREAIRSTTDGEAFRAEIDRERRSWARFYDTLDALETAVAAGDQAACRWRDVARAILDACRVQPADRRSTS